MAGDATKVLWAHWNEGEVRSRRSLSSSTPTVMAGITCDAEAGDEHSAEMRYRMLYGVGQRLSQAEGAGKNMRA